MSCRCAPLWCWTSLGFMTWPGSFSREQAELEAAEVVRIFSSEFLLYQYQMCLVVLSDTCKILKSQQVGGQCPERGVVNKKRLTEASILSPSLTETAHQASCPLSHSLGL